jgi:hypothetical protein
LNLQNNFLKVQRLQVESGPVEEFFSNLLIIFASL